jgi:hypothetical protein
MTATLVAPYRREERDRADQPGFAEYERKAASRKIPVIVLDPVK